MNKWYLDSLKTEIEVLRTRQNSVWIKIDKDYIYLYYIYIFIYILYIKALISGHKDSHQCCPHTFLSTQTLLMQQQTYTCFVSFFTPWTVLSCFCTSAVKRSQDPDPKSTFLLFSFFFFFYPSDKLNCCSFFSVDMKRKNLTRANKVNFKKKKKKKPFVSVSLKTSSTRLHIEGTSLR